MIIIGDLYIRDANDPDPREFDATSAQRAIDNARSAHRLSLKRQANRQRTTAEAAQ